MGEFGFPRPFGQSRPRNWISEGWDFQEIRASRGAFSWSTVFVHELHLKYKPQLMSIKYAWDTKIQD